MLRRKNLSNSLCAEVVSTTIYLLNISPTRALRKTTPFQEWKGVKSTVKHLRVFGSVSFVLIPIRGLQKLDAKSKKHIFVGYYNDSKSYRLYIQFLRR